MRVTPALVVWTIVAFACSGEAVDVVPGDADSGKDIIGKEVFEVILKTDIKNIETTSEVVPDVPAKELPQLQCDPGEGCFGDQCIGNEDCDSGWCVEHMGQKVCTQTCQEECPDGWTCTQVAGTAPDLVFVCVSKYPNLCSPCATTLECEGVTGTEDACILYGDQGSFCGGACGDDGECPWGFTCEDVVTVGGAELQQCVNDTGECPCTDTSVALGLWTPCKIENDFGACQGQRFCEEDGLGDCDAPEPAQEICNGTDDNCDGDVDEPVLVEGNFVNLCDDGNDCTEDKCLGENGCENTILDSGSCDDGNPCTVADHCDQGVCIGDSVECDDDNVCTDNVCTETGGCEYPFVPGGCDDEDPCTVGDLCVESECKGTAVPCDCQSDEECAILEDDDLCNGTLVCDTELFPYKCIINPETLVVCPEPEGENAFCLQDHCDPATGECSFIPNHEGFLCDNGDACTVNDKCAEGVCSGGVGVECNDGNVCTDDSCAPDSGCAYVNNNLACNDGDVCTTQDQCVEGECTGGPALDCDDGNVCNGMETCDQVVGCVVGEALVCDDGDICNGVETCDPVDGCSPGEALVCDDGDVCNGVESCDPAGGCLAGEQLACDDGDPCNGVETCDAVEGCQAGEPPDCNDNNVCTDDSCELGVGCVHAANEAACNDGNACTEGDHCQGGSCVFEWPKACNDGDVCTDDSCDPAQGCIFTLNEAPCDDENVCTTGDHCALGECISAGELLCDDGNDCTDDSCEPDVGCEFTPNQSECNDGDACTDGDMCAGGWCIGGPELDCDDDNVCTGSTCDSDLGCVIMLAEEGLPCGESIHWQCVQGVCTCIPDCEGRDCGDDGCGGSCGECKEEEFCSNSKCMLPLALPDSGMSTCYDSTGPIICPGPGQPYFGQDASYHTTPLGYANNGDGTALDLVTGLVWATCNAGKSGDACSGDAAVLGYEAAKEYCSQNLDGLPGQGWRLPNLDELTSMVDFEGSGYKSSPPFGGTMYTAFWAAPVGVTDVTHCFASFSTGQTGCGWLDPEVGQRFRCVRGFERSAGNFIDNEDGTVSDQATGLIWLKEPLGPATWKNALSDCESLQLAGADNWRLPNARELATLRDYRLPHKWLYEGFFEGPVANYWSGTTFQGAQYQGSAYALHQSGTVGFFSDSKYAGNEVRCVRQDCTPDCAGKECGEDGCGGICGACLPGFACDGGGCTSTGAVWFDGQHQMLADPGTKGPKTYSFWFYLEDVQPTQTLLIKKDTPGNPTPARPVNLVVQSGMLKAHMMYEGSGGSKEIAIAPVQPSTWHHVVWQVSPVKA